MTHLPPPGLPRFGGGERPPFSCKPPAPLTITMGQRLVLFASPISLRALNFPFSIARPSGPLSRLGKGGGGKGQMLPQATLGAILCAVRIDFGLPSKINPYPAQPATGVLGQSPKRVLVPFTRVKGTPRRRAVQAATLWWLLPAAGDCKLAPAGQAYRLKPFVKLPPPIGDYKPYHAPAHNPDHLHPPNPKTGNPHHPIKPKGARP